MLPDGLEAGRVGAVLAIVNGQHCSRLGGYAPSQGFCRCNALGTDLQLGQLSIRSTPCRHTTRLESNGNECEVRTEVLRHADSEACTSGLMRQATLSALMPLLTQVACESQITI